MSNNNLSQRLLLELGDQTPAEVTDLNLDNTKSNEIEGFTSEYKHLCNLSLVNVGLLSLDGLPFLESLKKLDISDNKLSDGLDILVQNTPLLEKLSLSGNKFKDFSTLQSLGGLGHLTSLDLYNCPVVRQGNFREEMFKLLPNLIYLDGFDRENEEEPEDDEDEEDDEEFEEGFDDEDEEDDEEEEEEEEEEVEGVENGNGKVVNGVNNGANNSGGLGQIMDEEEEEDDDYEEFDEEEEEEDDEEEGEESENLLKRHINPPEDAPAAKISPNKDLTDGQQ